MSSEQQFFDHIAKEWDDIRALDNLKLDKLIQKIDFRKSDRVLDVGCGTGVLVPFIKLQIGDSGSIIALDFSSEMIQRAADKYQHLKGIRFQVCDIMEYQHKNEFEKIVCLNFFPHVQDKIGFIKKMRTMLSDKGYLVIMHDISRQAVNGIHQECEAVKNDCLPEVNVLTQLLVAEGWGIIEAIDDGEIYFVKASKNQGL